jgi:hypothetical protein
MSDQEEENDLYHQKVGDKFDKIYDDYGKSDHADSMQNLLKGSNWAINRIVIMGIGDNWWQLSMILRLRYHLLKKSERIDVYSQEHYHNAPKEYKGNVEQYGADCFELQENQGISTNDYEKPKSASPGPIVAKITPVTLLFAPHLPYDTAAEALQGRNPELFIGDAMETIEEYCKNHELTVLENVAKNFRETHEWKKFEEMPAMLVNEEESKDSETGGFGNMFMYRRRGTGSKAYTTPTANGGWSRESAKDA